MAPLAKFDISLKKYSPGLASFCTESWQRFPPIFFSISLEPTNIVVRVHTKNYGNARKTKGIYRKTRKPLRRREAYGCPDRGREFDKRRDKELLKRLYNIYN